jgi:peptide/nickel transport system ATP-binding protein
VGESGSGKTTLARLIIGLTDRDSGALHLGEVLVSSSLHSRDKKILARLQMVFQNPQNSLNPYMTIGTTLRRPLLKLAGLSRRQADQEARRLLAAVNLREEYLRRYPHELSGGEKQRVAIARAFASHPDLIICDEPVSALDVSVQAAVLNLLEKLQRERDTSYLFISHDLAVVGYLADYAAVMYLGQLVEVGYTHSVFNPPLHPYTEALISAIPQPNPDHQTPHIRLSEDLPNLRDLHRGCRFHTRCPHKIGAVCETDHPPWRDGGEGHFIRCHIPLEELKTIQQKDSAS